ncbi:MAG: CRISPR-associated endonuclease Cas1 [Candidatus Methanomethylicaceae archaeon]
MKRFYILTHGCYLRKDGSVFKVIKDGEVLEEISLEQLEQLTIVGRSSISGAVLDELIKRRIETVLITPEGRFRARLMVNEHKHVERRMRQYALLGNADTRAELASTIVAAKIMSEGHFLLRRKSGDIRYLKKTGLRLKGLSDIASRERDLDILIGIEGTASKIYFEAFGELISADGFFFEGRNRRPPLDPVNAMLSFVYTLLTNEVLTAIQLVGLDPYLGALHGVEYGRPSLACDLVEEWRTFMGDRLVLMLINRRIIKPDDFVYRLEPYVEDEKTEFRPVEMKPEVMRAFIRAYEVWMSQTIKSPFSGQQTTYRNLIYDQAWRLLNWILGKEEKFLSFPWWNVV